MPKEYRNPTPTVDAIIHFQNKIVLIRRHNPPLGWALPGGFVDYGESLEEAIQREAREETGLQLHQLRQFHAYSHPQRDPRQHTLSVVFSAQGEGELLAGDDAADIALFPLTQLPSTLCFDHGRILAEYRQWLANGQRPDE